MVVNSNTNVHFTIEFSHVKSYCIVGFATPLPPSPSLPHPPPPPPSPSPSPRPPPSPPPHTTHHHHRSHFGSSHPRRGWLEFRSHGGSSPSAQLFIHCLHSVLSSQHVGHSLAFRPGPLLFWFVRSFAVSGSVPGAGWRLLMASSRH